MHDFLLHLAICVLGERVSRWSRVENFMLSNDNGVMWRQIFDDKLDWQSQEKIFNVMLSTLLGHLDDDKWLMENLIR